MRLSQTLKFAGYFFAIAGLAAVVIATIGVWVGKYFDLGVNVAYIFSWMRFRTLVVMLLLATGCFWLADWINKKAGLKSMAEEAGEKKSKWLPWT